MTTGLTIRPLCESDFESAIAAISEVGWGGLRAHFSLYLSDTYCFPFVAEVEGEIVGTAVGIRKGSVGWIGHVIVCQRWRGRGIGRALTETALTRLNSIGCRSLLLIATDLGRPVYERLGFRAESAYVQMRGPTLDRPPVDGRLRRLEAADLPAVCALDRAASGEDRARHLAAFAAGGWAVTGADVVVGYTHGYNDSDFLVNDLGIPTVNYGPGETGYAHTPQERLRVDHLLTAVRVYLQAALLVAG